jgi:hypothetical protein
MTKLPYDFNLLPDIKSVEDLHDMLINDSLGPFREDFGPFTMIGELRTMNNKSKNLPLDIIERLNLVSKGAISLFTEMKMHLDYTDNTVHYPTDKFTQSQKTMFSRYLSELKKVDLVRKVRKTHVYKRAPKHLYMINPTHVKCNAYSKALDIWKYL